MLIQEIAMFLFTLVLVAFALNLACWGLLKLFPGFFLKEENRRRLDSDLRYKGLDPDKGMAWFGLESARDIARYLKDKRDAENFQIEYEPLTEFRHRPFASRYVNISEYGFRKVGDQGSWPPDPANHNIFVFGGSTMFNWGPDETSIASRMQELLGARNGKPVKVYNFGRGAYYSAQELVLFLQLLERGHRPDEAVFFHGLNDFVRYDGFTVTTWLYREALRGDIASNREHNRALGEGRIRWFRLSMFMTSLPLCTVIQGLVRKLGVAETLSEVPRYTRGVPLSDKEIRAVVDRLLGVHRQIIAVAGAYGIRPWIVLQPHPAYGYDLSCHEALDPSGGLVGNERAGQGYPVLREAMGQESFYGGNLIDLSEIQQGVRKGLYLDEVHYTAEFSREIARRICAGIKERS